MTAAAATGRVKRSPAGWWWLVLPTPIVALAMLHWQHGWTAMMLFHATMAVALLLHRRSLPWKTWFRRPSAADWLRHAAAMAVAVPMLSAFVYDYANRHDGYGAALDGMLDRCAIPEATRIWFALQLCLLNPVLEELFWRGLFYRDRRRPAATDFCYAVFHLFALLPFMPVLQAALATASLVGYGWFLRQIARRQESSLVLPIVWHALGDAAIVVAIARLTQGG